MKSKMVTTSIEDMTKTAQDIGLPIDNVFCGYLRQPIHVRKGYEFYYISGACSNKTGYTCKNEISKDKPVSECPCPYYVRSGCGKKS